MLSISPRRSDALDDVLDHSGLAGEGAVCLGRLAGGEPDQGEQIERPDRGGPEEPPGEEADDLAHGQELPQSRPAHQQVAPGASLFDRQSVPHSHDHAVSGATPERLRGVHLLGLGRRDDEHVPGVVARAT